MATDNFDYSTSAAQKDSGTLEGTEILDGAKSTGFRVGIALSRLVTFLNTALAPKPKEYTVAALPAPSAANRGVLAWATDASGTKLVVSDGTNWKVVTIGATVAAA